MMSVLSMELHDWYERERKADEERETRKLLELKRLNDPPDDLTPEMRAAFEAEYEGLLGEDDELQLREVFVAGEWLSWRMGQLGYDEEAIRRTCFQFGQWAMVTGRPWGIVREAVAEMERRAATLDDGADPEVRSPH